jgi:hypothetical protein
MPPTTPGLCGNALACATFPYFNVIYNIRRDRIRLALQRAMAKGPGFRILVTGHSLGGALAQFAAVDLRNQGMTVDLVRSLFYSSLCHLANSVSYRHHMRRRVLVIRDLPISSRREPMCGTSRTSASSMPET